MTYVVCIPSRGRARICNDKTLTTLAVNGIPAERVHVYVADADEYALYQRTLTPALYGSLVIGRPGLVQQREFIEASWPAGQAIFYMDDDIGRIDLTLAGADRPGGSPTATDRPGGSPTATDRPGTTLDDFICAAFATCVANAAYIWGIYPVFNPFFRKARPEIVIAREQPVYIVGCMYGIINRPAYAEVRLQITCDDSQKEDVERTARYFLTDGVVIRFNRVGALTRYYGTVGGLGTFKERLDLARIAANKLAAKWPQLGKVRVRKNGMHEFVFARKCAKNRDRTNM
jgi:hypothetical protein